MSLWRVDIAGVSHRYVAAPSPEEAVDQVTDAIARGLDIRSSPAERVFAEAHAAAGPLVRKRILAALDGLNSPRSRSEIGQARAQLSRLLRWKEEAKAWARDRASESPGPPDPLELDRLVKLTELAHLERQRGLLRRAGIPPDVFNDT